jgi:hypothetical protein
VLTSCSYKQANIAKSATIIFKTPKIKFYDKGFINKFDEYINLQIYNAGTIVLNINIYKDKICKSTFTCMSSKKFNKKFLNNTYDDDFLYGLFSKKNIRFKDKNNFILIKVKYDRIAK